MSLSVPTPSMVVISALSGTLLIFTMQDLVTLPFMMTLQAPQWPSPQPILQPVSSRCSRRTFARVSSSDRTRLRVTPLMTSVFLTILYLLDIQKYIASSYKGVALIDCSVAVAAAGIVVKAFSGQVLHALNAARGIEDQL